MYKKLSIVVIAFTFLAVQTNMAQAINCPDIKTYIATVKDHRLLPRGFAFSLPHMTPEKDLSDKGIVFSSVNYQIGQGFGGLSQRVICKYKSTLPGDKDYIPSVEVLGNCSKIGGNWEERNTVKSDTCYPNTNSTGCDFVCR